MCANVVNVKVACIRPDYENLKEWMEDPNNVYIGRKGVVFIDGKRFPKEDSVWCNPFKIDFNYKDSTREAVIEKYKRYIIRKIEKGDVDLQDLRGKTLGCWCKPEMCHGDILIELLTYGCI
jgi:hypothetical protein